MKDRVCTGRFLTNGLVDVDFKIDYTGNGIINYTTIIIPDWIGYNFEEAKKEYVSQEQVMYIGQRLTKSG